METEDEVKWEARRGVWIEDAGWVDVEGDWAALHPRLHRTIIRSVALLRPRAVWIVDGSEREVDRLRAATDPAYARPLRHPPRSLLLRSPPEDRPVPSYMATPTADGVDIWMEPSVADDAIALRFPAAMQGRILFVVPVVLGLPGSDHALLALHLTDSPETVLALRLLVRISASAFWTKTASGWACRNYVTCVHTQGRPLPRLAQVPDLPLHSPLIIHRPLDKKPSIWSYGSVAGSGNAILTKTALSLRSSSVLARGQGWVPAHMAIFRVTRKADGAHRWFGAAFPPGCGKSTLALLDPHPSRGLHIRCLSDDIAWLRVNPATGRLCALNPEIGIYSLVSSTSQAACPRALDAMKEGDVIFTNTALVPSLGEPYWPGLRSLPANMPIESWTGEEFSLQDAGDNSAASLAARFAVPLSQIRDSMASVGTADYGVPLDAIIFGSRRSSHFPLVYEASHITDSHPDSCSHQCSPWLRGVAVGMSLRTEVVEKDPGGEVERMLKKEPFGGGCFSGLSVGATAAEWLALGSPEVQRLNRGVSLAMPRVYHVNWFREAEATGNLVWPGFGENARVLEWMMRRLDEGPGGNGLPSPTGKASLVGILPTPGSLDVTGLGLNEPALWKLTWVELMGEAVEVEEELVPDGDLPPALAQCLFAHLGAGFGEPFFRLRPRFQAISLSDASPSAQDSQFTL